MLLVLRFASVGITKKNIMMEITHKQEFKVDSETINKFIVENFKSGIWKDGYLWEVEQISKDVLPLDNPPNTHTVKLTRKTNGRL